MTGSNGNHEAFEMLVRAHAGRLLKVARRFLSVEEDAQDAVQDAFLAAYRSFESFESRALVSTWLHRIVVNACLMKLRYRRRKPEETVDYQLEPAIAWCESPERCFEKTELREIVRRAIDALPETFRVVLLMRDIEEMSTEAVAASLGVTENAVKIRLHRARQALREQLAQSHPRAAERAAAA